ncbi:hypothetical protein GCK32_014451 [Trichostrongylus colubriformis]|uniref:Uncharacterized protein n=1 Tax=Trichostrongylus colubriformis TaxID=6319 RepID=A0AAN8FIF6_TRICO
MFSLGTGHNKSFRKLKYAPKARNSAAKNKSFREDTPTSFRQFESKSPVLRTCKEKSAGSDVVLDETAESSLKDLQTNNSKGLTTSQQKQSSPVQRNPSRSAEPIISPRNKPEEKAEAQAAGKEIISVTPTTLTGKGSSAAPSTFKSSCVSSSQSTLANLARSTTNVLMSEDAGRTPPFCHSPQSGSFESALRGTKKARSQPGNAAV